MTYQTRCPECGGRLAVWSAFVEYSPPLLIHPDGFETFTAKRVDTSDERVVCLGCDFTHDGMIHIHESEAQ